MLIRPIWVDDRGYELATSYHAVGGPEGHTIADALQSYSNAKIGGIRFTTMFGPSGVVPPASGLYRGAGEIADLRFRSGFDGGQVHLILPAPKAMIFGADGETVSPGAIAGLTAECIATGYLLTPAGAQVTDFVGGVRRSIYRRVAL